MIYYSIYNILLKSSTTLFSYFFFFLCCLQWSLYICMFFFLCYYTSYPRSDWGKSWQDRKGSLLCAWAQRSCSRHGDGWPACGERLTWHGCCVASCAASDSWKNVMGWGGVSLRQPGFLLPSTGSGVFFSLGFGPRSNTALVCGAARETPGWGRVGSGADPGVSLGLRRCQPYPVGRPVLALKKKQRPEHWLRAGLSQEDTAKRAGGGRRGWDR